MSGVQNNGFDPSEGSSEVKSYFPQKSKTMWQKINHKLQKSVACDFQVITKLIVKHFKSLRLDMKLKKKKF